MDIFGGGLFGVILDTMGKKASSFEELKRYMAKQEAGLPEPAGVGTAGVASPAPGGNGVSAALVLCVELVDVAGEMKVEMNRLPAFIRPLVLKKFQEKTGRSVAEWGEMADGLKDRLERMERLDGAAWAEFGAGYPEQRALFEQLAAFCRAVPVELARLTSDTAKLEEAARISAEREALLNSLVAALDGITPSD